MSHIIVLGNQYQQALFETTKAAYQAALQESAPWDGSPKIQPPFVPSYMFDRNINVIGNNDIIA